MLKLNVVCAPLSVQEGRLASQFSVTVTDGGTSFFKGENFLGRVLQWRSEDGGLAIAASTFTSVFHLNDKNCDLRAVKRTLAGLIASLS